MEVAIRRVSVSDLETIADMEREIFGESSYPINYLAELYLNADYFMVATVGDWIVGYIIGRLERRVAHILSIAVREGYRRRGIGSMLLKSFIEYAIRRGALRVYLEVSDRNEVAINFYLRHGFRVVDRIRRYYPDGSDALVMDMPL